MAYVMKLNTPYKGMKFIYNLGGSVGTRKEDLNFPTDVELLQYLMAARLRVKPFKNLKTFPPPSVTGPFDALTGLNMLLFGATNRVLSEATYVSPATKGEAIFPGGVIWTIVHLNQQVFKYDRSAFDNLPNRVTSVLKEELKMPVGL